MRFGKYGKAFHRDKVKLGEGTIVRYTIFELKWIGGIIVNIFNTKAQDRFHTHAFHAISINLKGHYVEDRLNPSGLSYTTHKIKRGIRIIPKSCNHRIMRSSRNAVSITLCGPWQKTWTETFHGGVVKTYGWGRKRIY